LTYTFQSRKADGTLVFAVAYSEKGRKTKTDDILRAIKETGMTFDEDTLLHALRIFEKQSEVDYFINKNAKAFLKEQFDLWMYQYVFSGENAFIETRLKQLQIIKDVAYHIIDFIAQFEDELVRVWNKPKFVLNSNYVITLDKIASRNPNLLARLLKHKGIAPQVDEWRSLGMVDEKFKQADILEKDLLETPLHPQYQFLPFDTRHFKDLELDILAIFDDLDAALDGWLIHSENYQALNTLLRKFRDKVQTIYIDPPFNKQQDGDYFYSVKYKDTSWITILENRIRLAKELMSNISSIYVKCDYNGNMYTRMLLHDLFGMDKFRSELIWKRRTSTQVQYQSYAIMNDTIYCFSKTDEWIYDQQFEKYSDEYIKTQFRHEDDGEPYLIRNFYAAGDGPARVFFGKKIDPPKGHHWRYKQENIDKLIAKGKIILDSNGFPKLKQYLKEMRGKPYDNLLTDIHVVQGSAKEFTEFATQNPEKLLRLLILSSSRPGDYVMDFYLGSGTTTAAAHKLGRKWIGVEMGEHFYDIDLPRMKKVVFGEESGITKEVKWKGSGFFKYYDLEQYEDTLHRARYESTDAPLFQMTDVYSSYVFLRDLKLLDAVSLDKTADRIEVRPETLYEGIDLAETLSCVTGKWIKCITKDAVEFEDGTTASLSDPDWSLVKPLIWW
jgi:adenine specific DNA methylase Mod